MPDSFNPLDRRNLGESVANALLEQPPEPLPPANSFTGAGVYAIYYTGNFEAYGEISARNADGRFAQPIYVGKAVPPGARKGGFGLGQNPGDALYRRLREHASSTEAVESLAVADFVCRYLVTDDIWIPLAESLLIEQFQPLWNVLVSGFGIHDPGKGREGQKRSDWDMLHPGRSFASRRPPGERSPAEIELAIREFLAGRLRPNVDVATLVEGEE